LFSNQLQSDKVTIVKSLILFSFFFRPLQIVPRMLAENSGTKSAATVIAELSAAHKEENGKFVGYNIDVEQSITTDLVSILFTLCSDLLYETLKISLPSWGGILKFLLEVI